LATEGNIANCQPTIEELIRQHPDVPVFKYLLLRFMELKTGVRKLKSRFRYYADMHPDYLPFTYLYLNASLLDKDPDVELKMPDHLHLKNYYPGKTTFCIEEFLQYYHLLVTYYGISGDLVNLEMLISYTASKYSGVIPDTELFTARIMILPKVIEWCKEWMKG
jgi:hypothetical protein